MDLPEGCLLKEAYVAQAIAVADALIALTHFKGHSMGVIGGALKNLGIGAQSKRGRLNVHMGGHPNYGLGTAAEFNPEAAGKLLHIAGGANWQLRGFYGFMGAAAAEATYRETPGWMDWYDTQESQRRA